MNARFKDYTVEDLIDEIEDLEQRVDDLEDDVLYNERAAERLEEQLNELEAEDRDIAYVKQLITDLYIAKISASDREFDMQLREMFLKVLDKCL
jgi:hypothetical protein